MVPVTIYSYGYVVRIWLHNLCWLIPRLRRYGPGRCVTSHILIWLRSPVTRSPVTPGRYPRYVAGHTCIYIYLRLLRPGNYGPLPVVIADYGWIYYHSRYSRSIYPIAVIAVVYVVVRIVYVDLIYLL